MKNKIIKTLFIEYIGTILFLMILLFTKNIAIITIGLGILLMISSLFTNTHSFNPAISLLFMLTGKSDIKTSLFTIFIHLLAIITVFLIYKFFLN